MNQPFTVKSHIVDKDGNCVSIEEICRIANQALNDLDRSKQAHDTLATNMNLQEEEYKQQIEELQNRLMSYEKENIK
jgi:hypothetical protein